MKECPQMPAPKWSNMSLKFEFMKWRREKQYFYNLEVDSSWEWQMSFYYLTTAVSCIYKTSWFLVVD